MLISPPELVPFSRARYLSDLDYRTTCDLEAAGERHERLQLLLYPPLVSCENHSHS